jgi:hypothetical protein
MSARTWLNDKDGSQLEGVTVEVYLKPNNSESLANCSATANAQMRAQRCQIVSGKPSTAKSCTIALPCAADLKLVACAVSYVNGSKVLGVDGQPACSETPIGRNQSDWEVSPWAFLPDLGLLKDRQVRGGWSHRLFAGVAAEQREQLLMSFHAVACCLPDSGNDPAEGCWTWWRSAWSMLSASWRQWRSTYLMFSCGIHECCSVTAYKASSALSQHVPSEASQ